MSSDTNGLTNFQCVNCVPRQFEAALDADWLTAAWDQNAYNYVTGPAAAVVEECEPQTACGH